MQGMLAALRLRVLLCVLQIFTRFIIPLIQGCTIDWKKGKNVTVKVIKKKQKVLRGHSAFSCFICLLA